MNDHDINDIWVDSGSFDREYSLEELLPQAWLKDLHRVAGELLPQGLAVLHPEGNVHFIAGRWRKETLNRMSDFVAQERPETAIQPHLSIGNNICIIPLMHELEPKGYLSITAENAENVETDLKTGWGRAAGYVLQQIMDLRHQRLLTAGLHGTVVSESYIELKNKADQLALSEKKYRTLADSLEIEVQRKTEEIRLAQAHIMHQEKLAAIGQLAAGMAHEINNPLGAIISNLNTLIVYRVDIISIADHFSDLESALKECDTGRIDEFAMKIMQKISAAKEKLDFDFLLSDMEALVKESMDEAEKIQKIVADLKTVARPGIKKEECVDINKSIKAVLTIIGNSIGNNIKVDTILRPIPPVRAHAQDLNHIWLSLLLNALDAMDDDEGTITIETNHFENHITVHVSDTGCGIAPEHLPKIYDPFFTTKDVGKGTGLGLHSVYHQINELKGTIQVKSKVGEGTSFSVCLPVAESV